MAVRRALRHGRAKFEADAVVAVPGLHDFADHSGKSPGEQAPLALDNRYIASGFRGGAGGLEPDDAAANDDDVDLAMERLTQMHGGFDVAKIMNTSLGPLRRLVPPRVGAGCTPQP